MTQVGPGWMSARAGSTRPPRAPPPA